MSEYQALRDHDGNSGAPDPDDEHQGGAGTDWRANVADLGKKLGESMTVVGGKLSEQVGVVGDRMKELFHTPTLGERMVDEATSDVLIGPDWSKNLQICDLVNAGRMPGADVVRGVKRRLLLRNGHVQLLALALLETALKNCASLFSEVATEKVLDVMVRMVDDPTSAAALREKCLFLIEAWGEATEELRYLPVFEETYKSLKARGIVFPPRDAESLAPIFTPPQTVPGASGGAAAAGAGGRQPYYSPTPPVDLGPTGVFAYGGGAGGAGGATTQGGVLVLDSKEILSVARNSTELLSTVLTSAPAEEVVKDEVALSLAMQCRMSKRSVLQLVEHEQNNETLLFEALTVNDELDKVLEKLAELQKQVSPAAAPTPSPTPESTAPTPAQASGQMADLLAPPQALPLHQGAPPVTAFAVPSGEHEADADGEEALVRTRVGAGEGGAGGAAAGAAPAGDDERALAELDAMVFGRASQPQAPPPQGASPAAVSGQSKAKEDDLILF